MRHLALIALAACGPHRGPADDHGMLIPHDHRDATDCDRGVLDELRSGWNDLEPGVTPAIDHCLPGHFVDGGGAVVYASGHPDDPKGEVAGPARRVIVDDGGAIVAEAAPEGVDWMTGPPRPLQVVDLDGDGVDEVIDQTPEQPGASKYRVFFRRDEQLLATAPFAENESVDTDVGTFICPAKWQLDGRTLVVTGCDVERTKRYGFAAGALVPR